MCVRFSGDGNVIKFCCREVPFNFSKNYSTFIFNITPSLTDLKLDWTEDNSANEIGGEKTIL